MNDSASTAPASGRAPISPAQRRQIIWLSLGALAVFALFRWMPTGTNLNHGDFRLEGGNVLEFCDPAAPQFLPVTTVRSPVTFAVSPGEVSADVATTFTLKLATSTGKPIAPVDLLVAHTRKLHVMAVDPTLEDYHHLHPEPTETPGEWTVTFTPHRAGTYRLFADFTPAVTARGLYASADLVVGGSGSERGTAPAPTVYQFDLRYDRTQAQARTPLDLSLEISRRDGREVVLGEVMGAFAHLVAFDHERSGFAHLHPQETDLNLQLDALTPTLHFQVTIPEAGDYVIWAQVVLDGEDAYVPFALNVAP